MKLVWNPWLTVTSLCWGYNFVALKLLYREMSPPAVSILRFLLMYVIMVAICLATQRSLKYPQGLAWRIHLLGFVSMGLYMIAFLGGMGGTTPSEGSIILATSPLFTLGLAALVAREHLSWKVALGAVTALAGVALVVFDGSAKHGALWANALILLAAVLWASSAVMTRKLVADVDPIRLLTLAMPGGILALLPWGIPDFLKVDLTGLTSEAWLMVGHVAILSGVVAFIGFYKGVQQIGAGNAMFYQYSVPCLTALFSWLAMGQALRPLQWVGFGVVLAGVAYAQRIRAQEAVAGTLLGRND